MKPPAHVQVGPFRYRVTSKQATLDAVRRDDPTLFSGRTDTAALRILLDLNQCDAADTVRVTLLHEVLHAVWSLVGLDVDIDDNVEEQIVNRMAPALLDVLQRNADLVAFLAA